MKKILLPLLAILLCLSVAACSGAGGGKKDEELALDIRAAYIAAGKIAMTMKLTADYGDRVYTYKLQFQGSGDVGEVLVLEPEIISGLTAHFKNGATGLRFDGAELNTGALYGDGRSPMDAVASFLTAWQSGYISQCYTEKLGENQALAVVTSLSDTAVLTTWFDKETHLPLQAEILQDGFAAIRCEFESASLG